MISNKPKSKILHSIAEFTEGESYSSFKYCLDDINVPTVIYDDPQDIKFKKGGETDKGLKTPKSVEELAKSLLQKGLVLFKYFLDGSRKTYKVDDIAYGNKLFPIISGQVGVACCQRRSPDDFKSLIFKRSLVVSLPEIANAGSQESTLFFNNLAKKINEKEFLKNMGLKVDKVLPYSSSITKEETYEDKGTASIHTYMLESEKGLVKQLASEKKLNTDNYLIKDGSLEYQKMPKSEFKSLSNYKSNYARVVGVSKAFNPETLSKNVKGIAKIIAGLKTFERTPAFKYSTSRVGLDVHFAVWYLRLRDSTSPFDGIIKVEKVLVSEKEEEDGLSSDEIDLISANLMNERFPVSYGKDSRWAKHLYPIYLTESFIKSNYLSDVYFKHLF